MTEESAWIEWSGGKRPVGKDVLVCWQIRCETREEAEGCPPAPAGELHWKHDGKTEFQRGGEIIAYRVASPHNNPPIGDTK